MSPCGFQVGKLLAELVREPVAPGGAGGSSSRREGNAGAERAATGTAAGEAAQDFVHAGALVGI